MNQNCIDTVRLLLAIAPTVFAFGRFAMKGGTALNLFVQEMPIKQSANALRVRPRPPGRTALGYGSPTMPPAGPDGSNTCAPTVLRQKQKNPAFARLNC